jgi:hypothetical protein
MLLTGCRSRTQRFFSLGYMYFYNSSGLSQDFEKAKLDVCRKGTSFWTIVLRQRRLDRRKDEARPRSRARRDCCSRRRRSLGQVQACPVLPVWFEKTGAEQRKRPVKFALCSGRWLCPCHGVTRQQLRLQTIWLAGRGHCGLGVVSPSCQSGRPEPRLQNRRTAIGV